MSARHQPVVAESTTPGVWNVFCDACSQDVQDYVHPCKQGLEGFPPRQLRHTSKETARGMRVELELGDEAFAGWVEQAWRTYRAEATIERVRALAHEARNSVDYPVDEEDLLSNSMLIKFAERIDAALKEH